MMFGPKIQKFERFLNHLLPCIVDYMQWGMIITLSYQMMRFISRKYIYKFLIYEDSIQPFKYAFFLNSSIPPSEVTSLKFEFHQCTLRLLIKGTKSSDSTLVNGTPPCFSSSQRRTLKSPPTIHGL